MKAKIGAIGELTGTIKAIRREGDFIRGVMTVSGQVPYDIESYLSRRDIRRIIRLALKPSIMWYALSSLFWAKEPEPSNEESSEDIDW